MRVEQRSPVASCSHRLVTEAELGGLTRPIDRQVILADLFERLGGLLEPRGNLPVADVGADDRVDVTVEDRETLGVPVEGEPGVRVARLPTVLAVRARAEARLDLGEAAAVGGDACFAQGVGVRHDVEFEVVDELELDHPVDQLRQLDLRCGSFARVQVEEASARVPDDSAGVVRTGDHIDRARKCLVRDCVSLGRSRYGVLLEDVDRLVHVAAVGVRCAPALEIAPSADQGEDVVGEACRRDRSHAWSLPAVPGVHEPDAAQVTRGVVGVSAAGAGR